MKEKRDWPNQTAEYASNPERPNCRSFHEYLTSIFATISQNDAKKVTEEVVRCQPLKSFELEKRTLSGPGLVERQSSQVDGMWFSKSRPCSIISHAKLNFKFLELIFLFVSCWSSLPAARSSQWMILSADHTFVMTASFHLRITFCSTSTRNASSCCWCKRRCEHKWSSTKVTSCSACWKQFEKHSKGKGTWSQIVK